MEGSDHHQQQIPAGTSSNGSGNILQIVAAKPNLPPGYRFIPLDYELIFHLLNKIRDGEITVDIRDVILYKHHPKTLSETYPPLGEKKWYFFTPRNRKYPNGSRPNRTVGSGYWKATGADKRVYFQGETVGSKKTLVFYQGKQGRSTKTNWIMHEFRVCQSPCTKTDANDMKLDDWVLCRIHEKADSKLKRSHQEDVPNSQVEEVGNTEIQVVNNNEEELAAVLAMNRSDVAIASTSAPVVNHDSNGNPTYAEMDYALPYTQDVLNWPVLANGELSLNEQKPWYFEQELFWPVMENYHGVINHQQAGSFGNFHLQDGSFGNFDQQAGLFGNFHQQAGLHQQGMFNNGSFQQQQQQGGFNHGIFPGEVPPYYDFSTSTFSNSLADTPDNSQLTPRKRRC